MDHAPTTKKEPASAPKSAGFGVQMLGIGGLLDGGLGCRKQIRPAASKFKNPRFGDRIRPLADGLRPNSKDSSDCRRATTDEGEEFLLSHARIVIMITQKMQASLQRQNVMSLT